MIGGGGKKGAGNQAAGLSVIGEDVTVTGNIATAGDLHIDGKVEGDVACRALTQGSGGRIVGVVKVTTARLAGAIEGTVEAAELVIERAARIRGDVTYATLEIENGAQVDGKMTHRDGGAADAPLRLVDKAS